MPDWKKLVDELKRILGTEENDPLKIASEYTTRFGKTKLIQKISALLHVDDARAGKVHQKLTKIDFDTIYTTNFDHLLEQAFHKEKKPIITIVNDKDIGLYSPRTHTNIIKMHGDISHPTELILTEEDYNRYLRKHPIISTHLADMFATRTTLFIGYSLSDPHLNHIRRVIRNRLGSFQLKPYIIKFDASDAEIRKYERENFNVINLETKGKSREDCLLDFFCQVSDHVNVKAVDATMSKEDLVEPIEKMPKSKLKHVPPQYSGRIIQAFADLEVKLRKALKKLGYDKGEKPFNSIINHAVNLGLISPSDVNDINKVREIRNEVAHSIKSVNNDQVVYVEDICRTIIKKIQKIKKPKRKIIIKLSIIKNIYEVGDTLVISGTVNSIIPNMPVTVTIIDPAGRLVFVSQLFVRKNRFEEAISVGGALWNLTGKYVVKALYGHEDNHAEAEFTFKRTDELDKTKPLQAFPFKTSSGKIINISYLLKGNYILQDMTVEPTLCSLSIILQGNSDGELSIILPRNLIDARLGADGKSGGDDTFFVLVDGIESGFTESSTNTERVLSIKFSRGTSEIEIIGTHVLGVQSEIEKGDKVIVILEGSSSPREDEKYLKPQTMIIDIGDTVTWTNDDTAAHTITSGTPESGANGVFDSSLFMSGKRFSHTFTKKGTYRYYCVVHPWKEGKIIVK